MPSSESRVLTPNSLSRLAPGQRCVGMGLSKFRINIDAFLKFVQNLCFLPFPLILISAAFIPEFVSVCSLVFSKVRDTTRHPRTASPEASQGSTNIRHLDGYRPRSHLSRCALDRFPICGSIFFNSDSEFSQCQSNGHLWADQYGLCLLGGWQFFWVQLLYSP